jgi:TP901 family phage tail tape measure protein
MEGIEKIPQETQKAKKGIGALTGDFGKLAISMAGVNLGMQAIGGAIRQSIGESIQLSKGVREAAVLYEGPLSQSMKTVAKNIREVSLATGNLSSSLTKPYYDFVSAAGAANVTAENFADIMRAAEVGVGDLQSTVNFATTAVNAFQLSWDDVGYVTDLGAKAVERGVMTLGELGHSMSSVAPLASNLGLSLEEVVAATTSMTKGGFSAEKSTARLNQLMVSVANNQERAAKMGDDVASAFSLQALESKGLHVFLTDLYDVLDGDTEQMVKLLGSSEALQAMLALTGKNADIAKEDLEAMADASGLVNEKWDEILANDPAKQLEMAKNEFQVMATDIGTQLLPAITGLTKAGTFLLDVFRGIADMFGDYVLLIERQVVRSFEMLKTSIQSTVKIVKRYGETFSNVLQGNFKDAVESAKGIGEAVKEGFEKQADTYKAGWSETADWFMNEGIYANDVQDAIVDKAGTTGSNIGSAIEQSMKPKVKSAVKFAETELGKLLEKFDKTFEREQVERFGGGQLKTDMPISSGASPIDTPLDVTNPEIETTVTLLEQVQHYASQIGLDFYEAGIQLQDSLQPGMQGLVYDMMSLDSTGKQVWKNFGDYAMEQVKRISSALLSRGITKLLTTGLTGGGSLLGSIFGFEHGGSIRGNRVSSLAPLYAEKGLTVKRPTLFVAGEKSGGRLSQVEDIIPRDQRVAEAAQMFRAGQRNGTRIERHYHIHQPIIGDTRDMRKLEDKREDFELYSARFAG